MKPNTNKITAPTTNTNFTNFRQPQKYIVGNKKKEKEEEKKQNKKHRHRDITNCVTNQPDATRREGARAYSHSLAPVYIYEDRRSFSLVYLLARRPILLGRLPLGVRRRSEANANKVNAGS